MLSAHAKIGIAQIVFYVPAIAIAVYLLFFRHGRPRMPWVLLFVFSIVRFAGGIVLLCLNNNPNSTGLIIAALGLLGAGVFPLIVASLGLFRIIMASCFREISKLRFVIIFTRVLFIVGVALVVAGISLEAQYTKPNTVSLGLELAKAGFIVVTVIFLTLLGFEAYFWINLAKLGKNGLIILKATSTAMPFIAVRIAYALLAVFSAGGLQSKWNDLYGSVAAYVIMALVMEYAVVLIYLSVGIRIPPVKSMD